MGIPNILVVARVEVLSGVNCWAMIVAGVQDVIVYIGGHPRFCSPTPLLHPNRVPWNSTFSRFGQYDKYQVHYLHTDLCRCFECTLILTLHCLIHIIVGRRLYREFYASMNPFSPHFHPAISTTNSQYWILLQFLRTLLDGAAGPRTKSTQDS